MLLRKDRNKIELVYVKPGHHYVSHDIEYCDRININNLIDGRFQNSGCTLFEVNAKTKTIKLYDDFYNLLVVWRIKNV
jgi:hypothetical protein